MANWQMSADDRVRAHGAMLDAGQMHRSALAAQKPAFASHQLTEYAGHRGAARQRVIVAAIGAERVVVGVHGAGETGRDGLLTQPQMARAFDQVLKEQIVGPLFDMAAFKLKAPEINPFRLADIVVRQIRCWSFICWPFRQNVLPQLNFIVQCRRSAPAGPKFAPHRAVINKGWRSADLGLGTA